MLFLNKLWAQVRSVLQFRVKRWYTAMRGWDEKDIRVLICLEDEIWYWLLADEIVMSGFTRICDVLHWVKLPKFILNWERHWDKDDPEYFGKWEDWLGDDLGCIWHCYVEHKALNWVYKHRSNVQLPQFEMTLDEARQKFAHDPEVWQWVEKSLAEHREYDAEKAAKAEY